VQITATFSQAPTRTSRRVQVPEQGAAGSSRMPQEVLQQWRGGAEVAVQLSADRGISDTMGRYNNIDIPRFSRQPILDPISRVPGVGDVQVFGSPYAMRLGSIHTSSIRTT
jgi:multidrug efflux pump